MSAHGDSCREAKSLYKRLLDAAWVSYHYRSTAPERFYSKFYLGGQATRPRNRLFHAVIFLQAWTAWDFRSREDGPLQALEFLPRFLKDNESNILRLRRRTLLTLEESDFEMIDKLGSQLDRGLEFHNGTRSQRAPTAWGKLLHFLAPESVLLWDRSTVRDGPLQLDDHAADFVLLQRWGCRLIRFLEEYSPGTYERLPRDHRNTTHGKYDEPVAKIIDEMMYDQGTVRKAIAIIGGPYDFLSTS